MLDQLRQVAIFAKTIDHGSFRGAAKELRLSPSVVSHHISQLEAHLGVALLYRSTRKLALTREGEKLLAATHPMLEAMEGAFSQLSNSAASPTGELRLTTPSVLIQSHLTDLISSFSMRYPGIKLSLDYSDVRQDIIEGGHDIAIRMGVQMKSSGLVRNLFQVSRRLVASKAYLKNRPKVTTPQELLDWDWIELSPVRHIKPTFRKSTANSSSKANSKTKARSNGKPESQQITIKPTAHIAANEALAMYRLARSGAGLAVVPEFLAAESIASGAMKYVLPDWQLDPINVFATWHSNAPRHGLIKLFVDEIGPDQSLKNKPAKKTL